MNTHLLIIDPQNSFCSPEGELYVPGAENDMERLSLFITEHRDRIDKITITLDSHNKIHIAHPVWWVDKSGSQPAPFTQITGEDLEKRVWMAANPGYQDWSENYLKQNDTHIIWPYHCLLGTWGHRVYSPLNAAILDWAENKNDLEYIIKGTSKFTENFSIVKASVEVPDDPSTKTNIAFLNSLDASDTILVAGEASSHCVADSIRDMISERPLLTEKLVLLKDAMSPVAGFEKISDGFFEEMRDKKVSITTTKHLF